MARAPVNVQFPSSPVSPARQIRWRILLALLLIFVGSRDGVRGPRRLPRRRRHAAQRARRVLLLDGQRDHHRIRGHHARCRDSARLLTTLVITPTRVLFLILLVGTTVELLAARTRAGYRERHWRKGLKDHVIVCGFGTKGRSAVQAMIGSGNDRGADRRDRSRGGGRGGGQQGRSRGGARRRNECRGARAGEHP